MEKNKRIYYIMMALAAVVMVLTASACIVIADGVLIYSIALAVPVALAGGMVFLAMYLYPTITPDRNKKRKRRSTYVADPMGFRWLTAGSVSLGFALLLLCAAMWGMGRLSLAGFIVAAVLLLLAIYGAHLYFTVRIHRIAGQPVSKRLAKEVLLEALDAAADFLFLG